MATRKNNEADETEEVVVDDAADNTSDYVVVNGVLTLRREAEALYNTEGVTVVPADQTNEENT